MRRLFIVFLALFLLNNVSTNSEPSYKLSACEYSIQTNNSYTYLEHNQLLALPSKLFAKEAFVRLLYPLCFFSSVLPYELFLYAVLETNFSFLTHPAMRMLTYIRSPNTMKAVLLGRLNLY